MKILIVEPGKKPRAADIPNTREAMQQTVGGYIVVCPWEDNAVIVCDGISRIKGKPINRDIGTGLVIVGTFFVCGVGEEDLCGLTEEQLHKYTEILGGGSDMENLKFLTKEEHANAHPGMKEEREMDTAKQYKQQMQITKEGRDGEGVKERAT